MKKDSKQRLFEMMHRVSGMPLNENIIKNDSIPIGNRIEDITDHNNINWNPLYNFLKEIFGDRYKDVADGFMYMNSTRFFDEIDLYLYKNGITRKTIILDDNGNPWRIKYEMDGYNRYPKFLYTESNADAFKHVFENYESYLKDLGIEKKDIYFTKYRDYAPLRDKKLKDMGYKTVTKTSNDLNLMDGNEKNN